MTEDEQRAIEKANAAMKKLYDDAYKAATVKKSGKTAAGKVQLYNFNGVPAKWEYRKFPVKIVKGREVVEYNLYKFFQEAHRITEAEFRVLSK